MTLSMNFLNKKPPQPITIRRIVFIYYHAILNGSKTWGEAMIQDEFIYYHAILNGSKTSNSKILIACPL